MKKLKIFLIVFLFSIFLVPRETSALDYYNFSYNSRFNTYLSFTDEEKEDFITMLKNSASFDNDNTYYYERLNFNGTGTKAYLRRYTSSDPFIIVPMVFKTNSAYKRFAIFSSSIDNADYQEITYNCSSDLSSCTYSSKGNVITTTYDNFSLSQSDPSLYRYIYDSNQLEWLYATSVPNYGTGYDFASENDLIDSYSIDNQTTYTSGSSLTLYDLIGNFYPVSISPSVPKCDPDDFLGKFSNVSSFDVQVTGKTNVLSGILDGSFSIISDTNMSSTDWNLTFTHNDDEEAFFDSSISCNANRCVVNYQAWTNDDLDVNFLLNFHFEPASGITMPSTIQIYTCYNSNLYMNTTYSYINNGSGGSGGSVDIPSTDNFLQDGSLPDISGLSDTSIIPSGPIDSILLLPLNLMQSLLGVLNSSTCQPLNLPMPFDLGTLVLPCISTIYSQINGLNVFLNWFSAIFSAFLLYKYFLYLYNWVDDTLTFRENNHFGGY